MFIRHKQRAITAVSAGKVIVPKRTLDGGEPPPNGTFRLTIGAGAGGWYGYNRSEGYGAHTDARVTEQQSSQTDTYVLNFNGQKVNGDLLYCQMEGFVPMALNWHGVTNSYRAVVPGVNDWMAARDGQQIETSYAEP